ncbi:MAG: EamA family transporter [Paracoccaceae bacterium]|nr:EamA family transporter [Paracoccaceae bacterium]
MELSVRKHDLDNVVQLTLLVPFSGVFFAWLLLREQPSAQEMTGGILTILGVAILSLTSERLARLLSVRPARLLTPIDNEK